MATIDTKLWQLYGNYMSIVNILHKIYNNNTFLSMIAARNFLLST